MSELAERVPARFDWDGRPVAWFERSFFITWVVSFLVGLNGLFAIFWFYFGKARPRTLVNIPWKRYWFSAPERHAEAIERVRNLMAISGIFSNCVWLMAYHLCVQSALAAPVVRVPVNLAITLILGGTVIFVAGILLYMKPSRAS